jgi:acetyltransferase-like isoleucine patch superfamily enzyme
VWPLAGPKGYRNDVEKLPIDMHGAALARQCHRILDVPRRALMRCLARAYLSLHGVHCGKGLRIYSLPICRRHPQAAIALGRDVVITNKIRENLAGVFHRTVLVANKSGARLIVGNRVGISGAVLFCSNQIIIEDHVNLGAGAMIYDTDFHPLAAASRREHRADGIKTAPVRICEDVWVSANVTILKGVTIGPRSVVAAGAVVVDDIPADVLAAGVPAHVVRSLAEESASRDRFETSA